MHNGNVTASTSSAELFEAHEAQADMLRENLTLAKTVHRQKLDELNEARRALLEASTAAYRAQLSAQEVAEAGHIADGIASPSPYHHRVVDE